MSFARGAPPTGAVGPTPPDPVEKGWSGGLRIVMLTGDSWATLRNIRQNLFFALIYNALGVPIAAGVLYPVFGLLLSPMIAAAATTFSSV
ncbi:MAG: hypothetical protein HYY20_10630 [Candidatus Tectomicrobia bacterium]|uniref:Uncharacterized protein n=1 Tax=Tectimicrobiota bacterium TaxID=2528274 RepID=A0A932CQL4_UNCTE|nr:hypothetical protein [Candidatus Tectomicrobia bacterium]